MSQTIFMIHGMWGGGWYWSNYRSVFEAQGYHCIATTMPYHDMDPRGTPDPRLGTISLLDYADALEAEIKQLGEKPIIMGHSMGGLLAQILGARGLAKSLVLLCPAAPAGIMSVTPSVARSFLSIQTTWAHWRKPMRCTFGEFAYSTVNLMAMDEQKALYESLVYESGRAAFEIGFWLVDSRKASRVDETRITCPALIIGGGKDRIVPASVVRKVAKKYQAIATYKEFENHAHWVVGEPQWEEVADYVNEWLKTSA